MKRSAAVGSALGLLVALFVAAPAHADATGTYETSLDADGTLAVDVAGNAIAVASDLGDHVHFRYRHVNGHWSQLYALPGHTYWLPQSAQVAAGRAGEALVPVLIPSGMRSNLAAQIRRPNATWIAPHALSAGLIGNISGVDVVANADGDYAVSWNQFDFGLNGVKTYVAVLLHGGAWHRYLVGVKTVRATDVGIDSAGNVTVARTVESANGDPVRLLTRRKPWNHPWEAVSQVSATGQNVRWFDQIIERTGRRTYAYQDGSEGAPGDAPSYVLRQSVVGGPLQQVWQKSASSAPAIAADAGRLRISWGEQTNSTEPPVVMTQAFNPAATPPVQLTGLPQGAGNAQIAINRQGTGVLAATGTQDPDDPHPRVRVYSFTPTSVSGPTWLDKDSPIREDFVDGVDLALGVGQEFFAAFSVSDEAPATPTYTLRIFRGTH